MTIYPLNIFDALGRVSNNLSESEIAKCSPEQQAILFPLLSAWTETQEEDVRCLEAEANKRKAQTASDRAEKVLISVTPVWSQYDEWKRTVARIPVPEPDPTILKKVAAARRVVNAAAEYLAQCISEILPAQAVRDQKRRVFANLLREWSRNDGRPKDVGDLIKERVKTETAQKMANIKAGLDPNYIEHAASTVGPSHLDRMRSGMGMGGSADYGHNPNRNRGGTVARKSVV